MTIVGTRPEIIRLSRTIDKLDRHCEHVLVHTGQNYDYELNEVFFSDLGIRRPDHFMEAAGATAAERLYRPYEEVAEQLGLLVAGRNPSRAMDDGYRSFYELVAGQFAADDGCDFGIGIFQAVMPETLQRIGIGGVGQGTHRQASCDIWESFSTRRTWRSPAKSAVRKASRQALAISGPALLPNTPIAARSKRRFIAITMA